MNKHSTKYSHIIQRILSNSYNKILLHRFHYFPLSLWLCHRLPGYQKLKPSVAPMLYP